MEEHHTPPLCDDDNEDLCIFEDAEHFTEEEFFGVDVDAIPPPQEDDEIAYLHQIDRENIRQQQTSSFDEFDWTDCLISDKGERAIFNLNSAVRDSWDGFKVEANFIRRRVKTMILGEDEEDDERIEENTPTLKELFQFSIGPKSSFGAVFCKELNLDDSTYFNFLATVCIQMAYHQTPSAIYDTCSLLKDETVMDEADYIGIWKK